MEHKIGNFDFQTKPLDAFTQLHVARKLSPAFMLVEGMVRKENQNKDKTILVTLMLGQVSDEDTNYLLKTCLKVVFRKQMDSFSPILGKDGSLMFDDIPLTVLIELLSTVIEENLGDFFRTALSALPAVEQEGQN